MMGVHSFSFMFNIFKRLWAKHDLNLRAFDAEGLGSVALPLKRDTDLTNLTDCIFFSVKSVKSVALLYYLW
jgi:hypothetical protein